MALPFANFFGMADQYSKGMTAGVEQRGNVVLAIVAGLFAAAIGAGIWMAVEVALSLKIGFVAIAIGALVGFAIRLAGHGSHALFGVIGAVMTLAGCLGGEILSNLYLASSAQQSMADLARTTDYVAMVQTIFSKMDPIGYIIYGIGIFEGYKLSIVK
ncbi:MAG TPA: hypothetical protein VHY09_12560 [Candidatus Methylacidiphilales bacterium]|jgi:hypothetical protein|nr:hypothetical protein [Candidatus Methylacidiphilales bacterium]